MNDNGFPRARVYLLAGVGVSEPALWLVGCVSRGSGAIRRDYSVWHILVHSAGLKVLGELCVAVK